MIFERLTKIVKQIVKNPHIRVSLTLFSSVALNVVYVLMMIASGIFFRANWFYALAAYYVMLIVMRIFLLKDTLKVGGVESRIDEFRRYRFCGVVMLIMNLALAVIVGYVIGTDKGVGDSVGYAVGLIVYTFAAIIWASVNVIRYRKFNSPVLSAAKAISLASAVVSLISLERSVCATFGEIGSGRGSGMITGIAVCGFVFGMAVYMIAKANSEIRKLEQGNE